MAHSSTKSSALSSHSSFRSASPSVSSAAKSSAKAVECGTKRSRRGAKAIVRPLKRAKHALSKVSSIIGDDEDDPSSTEDEGSIKAIDVKSDGEELNDLEKELGMSSLLLLLPYLI
jgi:hypothetical protein